MPPKQETPDPLNYSGFLERPRRRFAWPVLVTIAVMAVLLAGALEIVAPHMRALYQSYHLDLPVWTRLVLAASNWMNPWGNIALAALPVALAILVPLMMAPPQTLEQAKLNAAKVSLIACGIYWISFLIVAGIFVALLAPMISLIQGITSSGK